MRELNKKKKELEKNKKENKEFEINDLKHRLNKLANIYRTTREIGIESGNYYKKEWWRSEKYTVNSRKSRPHICYYGPRKYDYTYEYESYSDSEDEKQYENCYEGVLDRQAKANIKYELF